MKRVLTITAVSTLATIAAWILIRGDLGFGGEMLIPISCSAWAIYKEMEKAEREEQE